MRTKHIFLIIFLIVGSTSFAQHLINPSVQLFGSPLVHVFEKEESVNYHQTFCYSLGIFLTNKIKISRGILSIRTGYFIDDKNYKEIFLDTINWYTKSVQTKFLYGNIPLFLGYSYAINKKLSPFISFGFIFGNILSQKQHRTYNNGDTKDGFPDLILNEKNPKYFHCSLGLDYNISARYSIEFEPYLKYLLVSKSPYNYDKNSKIAIGARIGIKYDINFTY